MSTESFNKFLNLLKTIRFGWLVPFFLLAKRDNPRAQLRAIFTGVCIPLLAMGSCLIIWNVASKQIVTKFGTVPGPRQVASAWGSLMNERRLEEIKEADHARRTREKRMNYLAKYESVVAQLPGSVPDLQFTDRAKAAMDEAKVKFDESNEILEVSNKLSIAPDENKAREIAASFKFDSSKALADVVISQLLPIEIAHRSNTEAFNMSEEFNPAGSDTEEEISAKEGLKKRRGKTLAGEKADLLIERQEITTLATKKALAVIESLPASKLKTLATIDRQSAALAPRFEAWHTEVEAAAAAGGPKFKDRVKLKMLMKNFADKPYPGKDTYFMQIVTSLKTVFAGFIIASLIAIPLGILCGLNKNINNAFNPIIQIFKPVSPLAWLPIVMIVVGAVYVSDDPMFEISFINSAITVALCSLWPTLVNTAVGVASTDKDYLNVARVLKLSWFKKIFKVVLPSSLPLVFTGLRLSLGVGWMVLIAAEMLAQNPGLGKFVWDMFQNGSSETLSMIMVAVFTIGVIGFFLDTIMLSLQQLVTFGEAV